MYALTIPNGADVEERMIYRRGYSAGFGKYLKANGTPAVPGRVAVAELKAHAAAWHNRHDGPRHEAGERAAKAALRAYWKRHGVEGREWLIGVQKRAQRRVTCEHCGEKTAA